MLREFTGEDKADSRLNTSTAEGRRLGHAAELASFVGDAIESVGDKVVHDRDGLLGDAGLRVHLFEDFEDVALEAHDTHLLETLFGHSFRSGLRSLRHIGKNKEDGRL